MRRLFLLICVILTTLSPAFVRAGSKALTAKLLDQVVKEMRFRCDLAINATDFPSQFGKIAFRLIRENLLAFSGADQNILRLAHSLDDPILTQLSREGRDKLEGLLKEKLDFFSILREKSKQEAKDIARGTVPFSDVNPEEREITVLKSQIDRDRFQEAIDYFDKMSKKAQQNIQARQMIALALNKNKGNEVADRAKALRILNAIVREVGPSAETISLIASVHKQEYFRYKRLSGEAQTQATDRLSRAQYHQTVENGAAAQAEYLTHVVLSRVAKENQLMAKRSLNRSIALYLQAVQLEPTNYYPAVACIGMLFERATPKDLEEIAELTVLAKRALLPRLKKNPTYWDWTSAIQLEVLRKNWKRVAKMIPRIRSFPVGVWQLRSTLDEFSNLLPIWENIGRTQKNTYSQEDLVRTQRLIDILSRMIEQKKAEDEAAVSKEGG